MPVTNRYNLTQQQKQRLEKVVRMLVDGYPAIAQYLIQLEDKLDTSLPSLESRIGSLFESKLINTSQSFKTALVSLENRLREDLPKSINKDELRGDKGEPGASYVLTDLDRQIIASLASMDIKVPVVEKIIERTEVIKEQPIVKEIKTETLVENPLTPEQIVERVNNSTELIDSSKVKGLSELWVKVKEYLSVPITTNFFNGLRAKNLNIVGATATQQGDTVNVTVPSGGSNNFADNEIVSFSGTTGTLAHTPISGSVKIYRGGVRQQPGGGNDYTISGATITLAVAASPGEVFLADYQY